MLYNLLELYREHLRARFCPTTARVYYERACTLLEGQNITSTVQKFDFNKVLSTLEKTNHKNEFSQYKNALMHFCEFQKIKVDNDIQKKIKELEQKMSKKYRKLKNASYEDISNKISHIRNTKLRLSYKILACTGLRVFEIAQITREDCIITNNAIEFHFIGKGGDIETVTLFKSEYTKLYKDVVTLINETQNNDKVFYSANYLQKKAQELNFRCHDLRRAYAKNEYKKSKAKNEVKDKMRHKNMKTTELYLKSQVDI